MFYRVTATPRKDAAAELLRKLENGSVRQQRPDGGEIAKGLREAVVLESGKVQWSMVCYCSTPLAHEKATVFDHHFDDLTTEPLDSREQYEGHSFMEHLTTLAAAAH